MLNVSQVPKPILIIGIIFFSTILYFIWDNLAPTQQIMQQFTNQSTNEQHREGEVVNEVDLAWEGEGAKVPLNQIKQGCFGKDCIPSIDEPRFESLEAGNEWLEDKDRVFVLQRNNISRIYPQAILNWHEIINDWFGEEPIAVTFCPLCGSAVAFERHVKGVTTEFGVSGKLHNNDLVMYDRYEGSLWQQITGEAIVGPAARRDEMLDPVLLNTLNWEEVQSRYPEAQVLSRETGFAKNYDRYPYGTYEKNDQIGVVPQQVDERFHPKTWVYGIEAGDQSVAFLEDDVRSQGIVTHQLNGTTIQITYENGQVNAVNQTTGETIVPLRMFWFAWAAFHPGTEVYQP